VIVLTQIAFYWEGNDPENEGKITYAELLAEVCKFANVLKGKGVQKVNASSRNRRFFSWPGVLSQLFWTRKLLYY
jgi:hypothetical protein